MNGEKPRPPHHKARSRNVPRATGPQSVGQVLADMLSAGPLRESHQRAKPVLLWARAVGPEMSSITRATSFRDGVLHVQTQGSAAAHFNTMHRPTWLRRINALLSEQGVKVQVREIHFSDGKLKGPPPKAFAPPIELSPEKLQQLDELSQRLGPESAAAARSMMEARERRRLNGTACSVCEQAGGHHVCTHCRRLERSPHIRRLVALALERPLVLQESFETHGAQAALLARHMALRRVAEGIAEASGALLSKELRAERSVAEVASECEAHLRLFVAIEKGMAAEELPQDLVPLLGDNEDLLNAWAMVRRSRGESSK